MDNPIIVTGHKNPDTDSICSAIAFAELKRSQGQNVKASRVGEINDETKFVLEKFDIPLPELNESVANQTVILVDHNEASQSPAGIESAKIIEILDHHKFNFSYSEAITITTKPLGCTATLVWQKYKESNVTIEPKIAGIMLSAILSDTTVFKLSTTTETDKEAAKELAQLAGIIDIEAYGVEVKNQKASITGKTADYLINSDLKEFDFKGKKAAIGQVELVKMDEFEARKTEFLADMERIKREKQYDFICFMATNIINMGTELLVVGDVSLVEKAFNKKVADNSMYLENAMSRKKDIVPFIEKAA